MPRAWTPRAGQTCTYLRPTTQKRVPALVVGPGSVSGIKIRVLGSRELIDNVARKVASTDVGVYDVAD